MTSILRPSGRPTVLHTGSICQIKRIEMEPCKSMSLKSHQFGAEHSFNVSGPGTAQIADQIVRVTAGNTIDIPIGFKHRISNNSNSCIFFVEVQTGNSFDEINIVRYEDDCGREQDFSILDSLFINQLIA